MQRRGHLGIEGHSVWYDLRQAAQGNAELGRLLDWSSLMYPRKLTEDVALIPYRSYRDGSIGIEMEPHDRDVERLVAYAVGNRWDLVGSIREFASRCMKNVVLFGEDAYEIVYDAKPNNEGRRQFSLARIPPRSLKHQAGHMAIQRVPKPIAKELHVPHEIHLPEDRLVIIEAPARVRKQLPLILERLAALSGSSPPDFALESLRLDGKKVPFDLKAFSRTKDLAVAAATREIGWSGHAIHLFREQRVVEHYWWYREFAFERFVIELSEAFLSALNQGLSRAGAECGFEGQLRFIGLPTLRDVDEAQQHLFAGDRSLTEINEAFRRG